jgi:hypothetical protein
MAQTPDSPELTINGEEIENVAAVRTTNAIVDFFYLKKK